MIISETNTHTLEALKEIEETADYIQAENIEEATIITLYKKDEKGLKSAQIDFVKEDKHNPAKYSEKWLETYTELLTVFTDHCNSPTSEYYDTAQDMCSSGGRWFVKEEISTITTQFEEKYKGIDWDSFHMDYYEACGQWLNDYLSKQ